MYRNKQKETPSRLLDAGVDLRTELVGSGAGSMPPVGPAELTLVVRDTAGVANAYKLRQQIARYGARSRSVGTSRIQLALPAAAAVVLSLTHHGWAYCSMDIVDIVHGQLDEPDGDERGDQQAASTMHKASRDQLIIVAL